MTERERECFGKGSTAAELELKWKLYQELEDAGNRGTGNVHVFGNRAAKAKLAQSIS